MSNYLPHSSKKLQILQRREISLFALINADAPPDKIVAAAEKVREARIRAIEAEYASAGVATLKSSIRDKRIEIIRELPIETILAYFGYEYCPSQHSVTS